MKTLAEEWDFLEKIVFKGLGADVEIDKDDVKRGFYAGAFVVMTGQLALAGEDIPEEEAARRLQTQYKEAESFLMGVLQNELKRSRVEGSSGLQ